MFPDLKTQSDFAILQAVGYQANYLFLATGQKGHTIGFIQVKRLDMG
jgi:hypothetical protein